MSNVFGNVFSIGNSSGLDANSPGNPYATVNDIISIYGSEFIDDYIADRPYPDVEPVINDCLAEAHDTMLTYLMHRYQEEEMRGRTWVIRREAKLAGYYLAQRRGQSIPVGIQQAYIAVLEDIESMANNTRRIIPGCPTRHQPGPTVSNFHIDNRFLRNRQRRDSDNSTSNHSGSTDSIDTDHFLP